MFFQNLSKFLDGTDITIVARGGSNQMTVSVVPKSTHEKVKTKFPVLTMTGTPEEIDKGFLEAIDKPVCGAVEFLVNKAAMEDATSEKKKKADDKKKEAEDKRDARTSQKKETPVAAPVVAPVASNQPSLF